MASSLNLGVAFLHEILACGEKEGSSSLSSGALALAIADSWRRAVSGGVGEFFPRRLAAEGLSEEEILARLQRGLCYWAEKTPRWLLLLQRVVPAEATVGEVPRLLARAAGRTCHRRFRVPLFSSGVPAALARQLEAQLGDLLAYARVPVSAGAWELFADRPLLARLLATRVWQWLRSCRRLARRIQQDHRQLEECLLGGGRLQVSELTLGLSDRHQQGETVARLTTLGGSAFYYKPRSLEPERVLSTFFEALRAVGLKLPLLPPMLVRAGYGWVREVPRATLQNRKQVEQWFFAAGHLTVAAWLLGLSDLHWENVVAGEEGPVVVDGETWCRPVTIFDGNGDESILSSGMVTFPANGPSGLRDDGALLGGMRPEAGSLPLFAGQAVNPSRYRESVLAGARDALEKLLWAWENGQLRLPFAELSRLRVRWVPRPSEAYASFLSFVLQNPRVRQCWQVSVLAETRWRGPLAAGIDTRVLRPLLQAETRAFHAFAIPRLTLPASRRGGVVRGSGKGQILRRLARLDQTFIRRQLAELASVFPVTTVDPEGRLRDAAATVAAVIHEEEACGTEDVGPFLRRGWAGRALAWAAWARASGDEKAALKVRRQLGKALEELQCRSGEALLPGYASGVGGVVYALFACGYWLEDPQLCELAFGLAKQALAGPRAPEHLDVEAGLAGLLLGAAECTRSFPELQEMLQRGAGRLVAAVQRAGANGDRNIWKPGFAHGLSGVAAALLQVAAVTGNRRWAEEAVLLLQQEPRAGTWLAEAELPRGEGFLVSMNGWCHGAAGALLAREMVPADLRTPPIAQQIQQAYTRVVPLKLASPLSLCCGSIGRSEISLLIGERAGNERLMDGARKLAALLFSSGLWRQELDTKGGLFEGLPGFLFHLSRLLAPDQLGSVLIAQQQPQTLGMVL